MDRIVVVGEERAAVDAAATAFERQGATVTRLERRDGVTAILADAPALLVVLCMATGGRADLDDLPCLIDASPDACIVPASLTLNPESALAAVRLGAFDLLTLPPTPEAVTALLARARLRRQQRALRLLRTLSKLSGWIAHEVRNPLSGILSSAQLLIGGPASSERHQRYLQLIIQEGERIEAFLKRVTDLGRSHSGPLGSASLNVVTERALARTEPQLRDRQIRLTRTFDLKVPEIRIDVVRMESAVARLIANAAAAMPSGGAMTVRTRYRPDDRMVDIEVTDTDLETGFARGRLLFGQCESSRLKEVGLGLVAALQTFVEHGGDLSLRILSDQGCSIVGQLPVNERDGQY